ncbi:MAG: hypothetical protein ACR2NZ_13475 [Rubripirellula sp.]
MANLVQVTCPHCAARLNVPQPDGTSASARCGSCQQIFTFRVAAKSQPTSQPQQSAQPTQPGTPQARSPHQGAPQHGGVADLGNLSLPAQPTSQGGFPPGRHQPASARTAGHNHARHRAKRKSGSGGSKTLLTVVAVLGSLLLIASIGGFALWFVFSKTSIVPPSMVPDSIATAFDSANSIVSTANENDLKLKRLVDALPSDSVPQAKIDEITEVSEDSRRLLFRAVNVDLLSPSEANTLTQLDSEGNVTGPLSQEETDGMRDHLMELPKDRRTTLLNLVSGGLKSNEFVREYLRYGHLEFPATSIPGEQVNARRIELLRELNRLGSQVILNAEPERGKQAKTREASKAYLNALYGPIEDDVANLAEQMHALAKARYELPDSDVGDADYLDEELYYTQQIQGRVFIANLALVQYGASIVEPMGDFLRASQDVDTARVGGKPSRIAKADEAKAKEEQAEQQREEERQAKIADAKRAREQAAKKEADSQKATEAAMAGGSNTPKDGSVANNGNGRAGSPSGPGEAFRGGRSGPPFGSGFGGRGGFAGRGANPGAMGGQSGPRGASGGQGPSGMGNARDDAANRSRRGGPPPGGSFETGTTIKMSGAENFDTRNHSQRFSKELGGSASVQIRNGEMVMRLQYKGPLDAVVKLVDFGKVTKVDEATRTITVISK